ncbi:MAG: NAD-dependent epimerase/dehydratase family protein [Dehalococcoidia bacterium]|nr:NAD-dependent epimerase/dehydratase family protein [Dehalococcoidia bacterium]
MTNRSVIVTGSTGFVAGHLIEQLVREGYNVTGIDLKKKLQPPTHWTEFTEDLRNFEKIRSILEKVKPDIVFHLAAQTSVAVSSREPVADVVHNVEVSVGLAQIITDLETPRLVFTSTGGAMYGEESSPPYTERTPENPKSIYGVSKLAVENYLRVVTNGSNTQISTIRPANIYGPEQSHLGEAGVVAIFGALMLANKDVTIFGTGEDTRDYIFVDDIVAILIKAATEDPGLYLAGTGVETSTNQIFNTLKKITGYDKLPVYQPARSGDVARSSLSSKKAQQLWGWKPEIDLEDGLTKTVTWLRDTI